MSSFSFNVNTLTTILKIFNFKLIKFFKFIFASANNDHLECSKVCIRAGWDNGGCNRDDYYKPKCQCTGGKVGAGNKGSAGNKEGAVSGNRECSMACATGGWKTGQFNGDKCECSGEQTLARGR